jgi:hypothetical protein
MSHKPRTVLERLSERSITWIGSVPSLVTHTLFFAGVFVLRLFGMSSDRVLLILTTVVSLEAIYLSIFLQMTVNWNTESLVGVEENIEELGEKVEDLDENLDELSEDVDNIQAKEAKEAKEGRHDLLTRSAIDTIDISTKRLMEEIETLKQAIRKQ